MTIMQHVGFIIGYIILLGIAVGIATKFISIDDDFSVKLEDAEDSVVANRVVRCFSKEGEFGVVDVSKMSDEALRNWNCMGDKYLLNIKLVRMEGDDIKIETGSLGQARVVNRYVIVDGKAAKLEVDYSER